MTDDEVVREVRAAREAFAASHGYDIRAMVAALHEWGRQRPGGGPVRPAITAAAEPAAADRGCRTGFREFVTHRGGPGR